jgi:hypothetical protein
MRREDPERYPERGDRLGFRKETGDDAYIGWIMLSKNKPHERYLSLLRRFGHALEEIKWARDIDSN